jgi:hypothetical protein
MGAPLLPPLSLGLVGLGLELVLVEDVLVDEELAMLVDLEDEAVLAPSGLLA